MPIVPHSYKERSEGEGEKVKHEFPKLLIGTYMKESQHIHFLVHGHFSWPMFGLHVSQGSKGFKNALLGSWTMEVLA